MLFKLLRRESILAVGTRVVGVGPRLVEGVDHQRARHFHRLSTGTVVKHQPAAETAHGRLAFGAADGVGPEGDHAQRPAKLARAAKQRGQILLHAEIGELRAARRGGEQADDDEVRSFHAGLLVGVVGRGCWLLIGLRG
jgi:hypothetical protein